MRDNNKYFFYELPKGYREICLYDVNGKKFKIITGPVSFIISVLVAVLLFFSKIGFNIDNFNMTWTPLYLFHILTVIVLILVYTIVHELIHGFVYKMFTHRKLKFGLTGSLAYCGVPGIYVKRNVAAISCAAPFVVFTIIYLTLLYIMPVSAFWFALLISFMNHIGGCFADIYAFIVMMKNGKDLLMLDDGKTQRIFVMVNDKKIA